MKRKTIKKYFPELFDTLNRVLTEIIIDDPERVELFDFDLNFVYDILQDDKGKNFEYPYITVTPRLKGASIPCDDHATVLPGGDWDYRGIEFAMSQAIRAENQKQIEKLEQQIAELKAA